MSSPASATLAFFPDGESPVDAGAGATARPDRTEALTRGAARLMIDMGLCVIPEFRLPNGRRADLAGLGPKGEVIIVEIKSCREDLAVDAKWREYRDYCDRFYFGVSEIFPVEMIPEEEGVIIADGFGGAVLREGELTKLSGPRRKAVTLRFARQAAGIAARAAAIA